MKDCLIPFQLEIAPVRGRVVRLTEIVATLKVQHRYPPAVQEILNQLVALGLMLASGFKYEGIFTLQMIGNGPVRLMVVDITHEFHVRACARFDEKRIPSHTNLKTIFGEGMLTFTVDQPAVTDRYQGIVTLTGDTLVEIIHHYFYQSEQLKTQVALFNRPSHKDPNQFYEVGALLIQRMPTVSEGPDIWEDLVTFVSTLSSEELLDSDLPAEKLLHRLFWQEGIHLYPGKTVLVKCRCSYEKIHQLLTTFQIEDREAMIVEGKIEVTCEFCNTTYRVEPF